MNNNTSKGPVTVLGIDLAKQSFQFHGINKDGQVFVDHYSRQPHTKARYMGALFLYVTSKFFLQYGVDQI